MLTDEEIKTLVGLIEPLTEASQVPAFMDAMLHPAMVPIFPRPHAFAPRRYIEEAIRFSLKMGGASNPPAIIYLCERVEETGVPVPFDFRRVKPAANHAPTFTRLQLSGNRPYVGGERLRNRLTELSASAPSRTVIALVGEWNSGKSYSSHLIEEHCLENEAELSVTIDATGLGAGFGPADLASTLISYLGGDPADIVAPHNRNLETNPTAWYNTLANRIVGAANKAVRELGFQRIWLFIDGLGEVEYAPDPQSPQPPEKTEPRADLVDFIKILTHAVTQGLNRRNFRMVVSGLEMRLHEHFPAKVLEHRMEPVDDSDVRQFIEFRVAASDAEESERAHLVDAMMAMLGSTKNGASYDLPKLRRALEAM